MSGRPILAAASNSSGQASPPSDSHKSSRKSASGKPKRTLIESACAACRRRKSRCDGVRPCCSRCQALNTECHYQAEEGESRWSALRRKNHDLQKERDDAKELVSLIQSRPDAESQEIYHLIRTNNFGGDIGAFVRAVQNGGLAPEIARHQQQEQPSQSQQQPQAQQQYNQQPAVPPPYIPQDQGFHANMQQLPPLRSIVDLPPVGSTVIPGPNPVQRQGSMASATTSGSYSSLSSSEQDRISVSPQDLPHGWS